MYLNADDILTAEKLNFHLPKDKKEVNNPSIDFLLNEEIESRTGGEQIYLCFDASCIHQCTIDSTSRQLLYLHI